MFAVWRRGWGFIWIRIGYTWGSAPIDPFTFPHTSGIAATVSAKHLLRASSVFDFPQRWPPHPHQFHWPMSLPLLEDYPEGWTHICIFICTHICIGSSYTSHYSWTLLTSRSPLWASSCFTAQPEESRQRGVSACHCERCLESPLAISGKQITHETRTLSRRVTHLAQQARAPVALSGRIRKN